MEIKPFTIRKSVVYPAAAIATGLLCSCSGQQPGQILLGAPIPCTEHSSDSSDKGPRQQQPPQRIPGKVKKNYHGN